MMHLAYIEKKLNPDTCNKYTTVCHYRIPPMRCCEAQPLGKCRVSLFPSCDDITMKDNPAPLFPCSPFIPFWKCNLRNVVILCWDVMMVGDRQPVVSLVFPSAPPKKKRGKKKLLPDESGLYCGLTVPLLSCVVGWYHCHGLRTGGTIIRPAYIFSHCGCAWVLAWVFLPFPLCCCIFPLPI